MAFRTGRPSKSKIGAKWDPEVVDDICCWMKSLTGKDVPHRDQDEFAKSLKDGVTLCALANKIEPGVIKKPHENPGKMAFKQMENIGWFCDFVTNYGVDMSYKFVTVDLYEKQNVWQVVLGIRALKDKAAEKGITG